MIAYAEATLLIEMPVPQLITTAAQWPNMNNQIQIELEPSSAHPCVRIKDEIISLKPKKVSAFLSFVDSSGGPDACWPWQGCCNRDGYGAYEVKGKYIGAHRMAYQLKFGPIDKGVQVNHNCPNGDLPSCCNPAHLWLGTQHENILDMERKGRARHPKGDEHGKRLHPELVLRGEKCNLSKLTESDVLEIRSLFTAGNYSQPAIAEKFSITQQCVSSIIKRKTWAHLP